MRVILYTKPACPFCASARLSLRMRGIDFDEYNVKADPQRLAEMLRLNGGLRRIPTIVEGEKVSIGFGGY